MTKSRARWADTATDLSNDVAQAAKQLTVGQLADATGLSRRTIEDSLTREKITAKDNPRGAIDRPQFMIGGMPLWSPDQVADYAARKARQERRLAELPLVSPEAAQMRGLISTSEVAQLVGKHDQTVRRWESSFGDYPPAVARRSRNKRPGVPEHVRELAKILDWLRGENARRADEGREPLAVLPETTTAAS